MLAKKSSHRGYRKLEESMKGYFSHYPRSFTRRLKNRKSILMIGAGISSKCLDEHRKPLPNWFEFLEGFIEWERDRRALDTNEYGELRTLLDQRKHELVAQELLEKVSTDDFQIFLDTLFNPNNVIPSYLHNLIPILPFRGIITTNYDNLIERAYVQCHNRLPNVFLWSEIEAGANPFEKDHFIVKLHGDIEDPSSIILNQQSYTNLLYNCPNYRDFLERLLREYSILFIGYGGSDQDIEATINKISIQSKAGKKNRHFLLSKSGNLTKIEKKRLLIDKGIEVVEYVDYFGLHNHVDTFMNLALLKLEKGGFIPEGNIPSKLRSRIRVRYDKCDIDDGLFVWNYFFKRGAITDAEFAQEDQYERFIADPVDGKYTDFLVVFLGETDFKSDSNAFLDAISRSLKQGDEYGFHTILISLEKNKEVIPSKFATLPVFYVPNGFSESHLTTVDSYIAEKVIFFRRK